MKLSRIFKFVYIILIGVLLCSLSFSVVTGIILRDNLKNYEHVFTFSHDTAELLVMTTGFLANQGDRENRQWRLKYYSTQKTFRYFEINDEIDRKLVQRINQDFMAMAEIFTLISKKTEKHKTNLSSLERSDYYRFQLNRFLFHNIRLFEDTLLLGRVSFSKIRQDHRRLQIILLVFWVVFVIICLVLARLIRQRIILPINDLAKAMHSFSLGDYTASMKKSYPDEFGQLAEVFNHMKSIVLTHEQLLEKETITDKLTQLYNRRYLDERLMQECQRAKRYQRPLSLLFIDIDDFKDYNDRYGHLEGDKILISMRDLFHRILRGTDSSFRYGGEEFVLLLIETDLGNAVKIAEKTRQTFASFEFQPTDTDVIHKTISVGVVSYYIGESADDFLRRADAAMYKAKQNGKNQSVSE